MSESNHFRNDYHESKEIVSGPMVTKWMVRKIMKKVFVLLLLGLIVHLFISSKSPTKGKAKKEKTVDTNIVHHYLYLGDLFKSPESEILKTVFTDNEAKYKKTVYTNKNIEHSGEESTVLMMVSVGSESAYGPGKTLSLFMNNLNSLNFNPRLISIGLLCATKKAEEDAISYFDLLKNEKTPFRYARVTIISEDFMGEAFSRHDELDSIQRSRRRMIAKARNFALFNSLRDERYVLFVDADIYKFDNQDMLNIFIDLDLDIIVPRIQRGDVLDYDRNTWTGKRVVPLQKQLKLMNSGKYDEAGFIPNDTPETWHIVDEVEKIVKLPKDAHERSIDYAYQVDSVGGAVLFAKSVVYKQGVVFPPLYIIGTHQDRVEGYDGIETEGLCYVAKLLDYKCWAMPNIVAQHVL